MSKSWHQYSKLGMDSEYRNLMGRNLASNEVAKVNRLHANNICVSQNVDICGNTVIDGTLDVSGHSQLCDVSACNVDISQNLQVDASVNFTTGVINTPRYANTTGLTGNVFIGDDSGINTSNASATNTCVGNKTLSSAVDGGLADNRTFNSAFGNSALENLAHHTSGENSCFGANASQYLQNGINNLSLGTNAGRTYGDGASDNATEYNDCCYIGYNTRPSAATGIIDEIVIGADALGKGSNTVQIGNCDITDVYLGCDGGVTSTTLHVDNIICHNIDGSGGDTHTVCDLSACNVDISQNLRAGIGGLTSAQLTGGVGSINNPRIICDVSDNVIIGEGALNGLNPSAPYTKQNVVIGKNAMFNHTSPASESYQNVAIGDSALEWCLDAEDTVAVGLNAGSYFGGTTGSAKVTNRRFGCTYLGTSTYSKDDSMQTNEIVIGDAAIGKGSNTVQIGNCDVNDVYLGCDGSGTTLHVDDISASNVDINSLTVSGENVYNALFGGSEMAHKTIYSKGNTSGNIGLIPASIAVNHGVIFLQPDPSNSTVASSGPTSYIWQLESSGSVVEGVRNSFQSIESTLFLKFSLINSDPSRNMTLLFNNFDAFSNSVGETVIPRGTPSQGGLTMPSIVRWNGGNTIETSQSMIGGVEISWNGDSWSVVNGFNFNEIKNALDTKLLISG